MVPPARVTIGVMGSGSDEFDDVAKPLGKLLANLQVNLPTGAGIALPGGPGTASEVELAVRYQKPIPAFSPNEALVSAFHPGVRRAR